LTENAIYNSARHWIKKGGSHCGRCGPLFGGTKDISSEKAPQNERPAKLQDFESVAKRLECDEDKERFEAKLGKLARAKPTTK
jgi:hypothetical protein